MSKERWPEMVAVVAGVALGLGGCARISETTTFTHTPVSRRSSMEIVADSVEYSAASRIEGQSLLLTIHRAETCRTKVVPILRKEAHTRRAVAGSGAGVASSPWTTLALGLACLGLGGYMYVDAEALSASSSDPEESSPDDYRRGGVLLAGGSGLLFGVALVDALRLRDSHEVIGDVEGEPEITAAQCRRAPAGDVTVQVTAGRSSWRSSVRTDAAGQARVELRALDEAAFTGGPLALQLQIDARRLALELPAGEAEALLAALAAEPSSRVAIDREQRRRAECERAVASAGAQAVQETSTDEEVERAALAWQQAQQTCGRDWRPAHGAARDALLAQIEATATARAAARCERSVERAKDELTRWLEEQEEELDLEPHAQDIAQACAGAPNAAAMKASWARQAAVVAAAGELQENLDEHDAVALRLQLRDPNLAAAFRQPRLAQVFPPLVAHWLGVLERGGGGEGARRQLCAARALYLSFVGKGGWAKLRAEVARRNDVMKAAQLVRLMDGGGCP